MRLRTAHKRKVQKLFGLKLPRPALERVLLCNRFAASSHSYIQFFCRRDFGGGYWHTYQLIDARANGTPIGYYFKSLFYSIKDRIMDKYGKFKGYTLQHWTSTSWDDDYEGRAYHEHILERVRLGNVTLHRPTGHFSYWTEGDYEKETAGFQDLKKQCSEKIEGKKRITEHVPPKTAALAALRWLCLRYGHLKAKPKEKPAIRVREYAYYVAPPVAQQKHALDDDSIPF